MKSPKKLAPIFAEIEPYIYLCNVKEMINRNVAQLVAHYVRDVGVGRSSRLIPTEGDKRAKSVVAFSFSPSQTAVNLRKILKTSFSFSVR